jgi:hypothetical protein
LGRNWYYNNLNWRCDVDRSFIYNVEGRPIPKKNVWLEGACITRNDTLSDLEVCQEFFIDYYCKTPQFNKPPYDRWEHAGKFCVVILGLNLFMFILLWCLHNMKHKSTNMPFIPKKKRPLNVSKSFKLKN